MKLTLPLPPSNNTYKRHYCTRSSRFDPHPVSAVLTDAAKQFYADVQSVALVERAVLIEGPVRAIIVVYCADNYDSDNATKVLFDALQGVAFPNDRNIREHHVYKRYVPHRRDYRVEIEIEPIE